MRKKTTEQFIKESQAVHGDRYDYSLSEYSGLTDKVKISCRDHGIFFQSPKHHLIGSGCPECAGVKRIDTETFIVKAVSAHGFKYGYSKISVSNSTQRVTVVCDKHGDFEQSVSDHLRGAGCIKCVRESHTHDTQLFIMKAEVVHNFTYDYCCVDYINSKTKVTILCKKCYLFFEQTPNDHLRGFGCPGCSKSGFKTDKTGYLYALLSSDGMSIKIGITNDLRKRVDVLRRVTPFPFEVYRTWCGNGKDIRKCEASIHKSFESARISGFQGCTEWLRFDTRIVDVINRKFR